MPFANYEKYSLGFHKHHSIMHAEIRSPQELCETHFSEVVKETVGSGQGGTDLGALLSELQGLRWVLRYLVDGPQVPVPCCQDKQYSQASAQHRAKMLCHPRFLISLRATSSPKERRTREQKPTYHQIACLCRSSWQRLCAGIKGGIGWGPVSLLALRSDWCHLYPQLQ